MRIPGMRSQKPDASLRSASNWGGADLRDRDFFEAEAGSLGPADRPPKTLLKYTVVDNTHGEKTRGRSMLDGQEGKREKGADWQRKDEDSTAKVALSKLLPAPRGGHHDNGHASAPTRSAASAQESSFLALGFRLRFGADLGLRLFSIFDCQYLSPCRGTWFPLYAAMFN